MLHVVWTEKELDGIVVGSSKEIRTPYLCIVDR